VERVTKVMGRKDSYEMGAVNRLTSSRGSPVSSAKEGLRERRSIVLLTKSDPTAVSVVSQRGGGKQRYIGSESSMEMGSPLPIRKSNG